MAYFYSEQEVATEFGQNIAFTYNDTYAHHKSLAQRLVDFANISPSENVLDLGTGTGWVLKEVKQRIGNGIAVGLDASEDMLREAQHYLLQHRQLLQLQTGLVATRKGNIWNPVHLNAIREELVPQAGFNAITALLVYDNIPLERRKAALSTWLGLLAPNGRIVLSMCLLYRDSQFPDVIALKVNSTERKVLRIAPRFLYTRSQEQAHTHITGTGLRVARTTSSKHDDYGNHIELIDISADIEAFLCEKKRVPSLEGEDFIEEIQEVSEHICEYSKAKGAYQRALAAVSKDEKTAKVELERVLVFAKDRCIRTAQNETMRWLGRHGVNICGCMDAWIHTLYAIVELRQE